MNRTLKNLALWLIAAVLFVILYHMLYPNRLSQFFSAFKPSQVRESAQQLMLDKQALEQKKYDLEAKIAEQSAAPTSIFILFTEISEAFLEEAAPALDRLNLDGLLAVKKADVLKWIQEGTPAYLRERMNEGWEICLVVEDEPIRNVQNWLTVAGLPQARAALQQGKGEATAQDGLYLLLEQDAAVSSRALDGLWHIPAMGNMHAEALTLYNEQRYRGSAIAYLVGGHSADQRYSADNLAALLRLIEEDIGRKAVQCVKAEEAWRLRFQYESQMSVLQQEWELQKKLINQQIGVLQQKMDALEAP